MCLAIMFQRVAPANVVFEGQISAILMGFLDGGRPEFMFSIVIPFMFGRDTTVPQYIEFLFSTV